MVDECLKVSLLAASFRPFASPVLASSRCRGRSTCPPNRKRCANGTSATRRAKLVSWRGAGSRRAWGSSPRFGTKATADRTRPRDRPTLTAGTRTTAFPRRCGSTCCRGSTWVSRRCWKTLKGVGSWTGPCYGSLPLLKALERRQRERYPPKLTVGDESGIVTYNDLDEKPKAKTPDEARKLAEKGDEVWR